MSEGLDFEVNTKEHYILDNPDKDCNLQSLETVLSIVSLEKVNTFSAKNEVETFNESHEKNEFSSDNFTANAFYLNSLFTEESKPETESKFKSKSKLLKVSEKIQIEKENKKIAKFRKNEFVDSEAELGSDKEEHDDVIKRIQDVDEDDSDNQEDDLPDLIDKTEEIIEGNDEIQKKFFNEMMDQDKKEIKQVINGPIERQKRLRSNIDKLPDTEDDYLALNMRIKKFKSSSTEEKNDPGFMVNFLSIQKQFEEEINDDNQDEELSKMVKTYENNMIKKIAEKSVNIDDIIELRNKENDKILENVVIRNTAPNICFTNNSNLLKSKGVVTKQNLALNFKYNSAKQRTSLLFGNKEDSTGLSNSNKNNNFKSITNLTPSGTIQIQPVVNNAFLHNPNKTNLSSLFRKTAQIQKLEKQKNQNVITSGKKHAKKNQNLENFTNSLQNCK